MRDPQCRQSLPGGAPQRHSRASWAESDGDSDDDASDAHERCPFRQILSIRPASWRAMVVQHSGPLDSLVAVRGQRLSDGRGKSVRFADSEWRYRMGGGDTYLNGYYDVNRNAPEKGSRGRFYRRHDGRFVTRSEPRLDIPGVYGPIPYSKAQPVSPQDILRNIRYQARCSAWENHENCPFREILRIQPGKVSSARDKLQKKAKATSTSPSIRRRHTLPDMKVTGLRATSQGLRDLVVEETDPVARKWPSLREAPRKTWPAGGKLKTVSFEDPPPALTGRAKSPLKLTGPQEHGVGCR